MLYFTSTGLHYSGEIHPYVDNFLYFCPLKLRKECNLLEMSVC